MSAPQEAITSIQTLIQGKAKLEQEKSTLQGYKNELNSGLEEYNKGLKNFENLFCLVGKLSVPTLCEYVLIESCD